MTLHQWAIKHGVTAHALAELRAIMVPDTGVPLVTGASEAAVQSQVRMDASKAGWRLWRNNIGAYKDEHGNFIRYGLCNDSAKMNELIKMGDLVGIKPTIITPEMIGSVLGQFVMRECKPVAWRYTGTEREQGQLRAIQMVTALGGDAKFTNGRGEL